MRKPPAMVWATAIRTLRATTTTRLLVTRAIRARPEVLETSVDSSAAQKTSVARVVDVLALWGTASV